ncbi:Bifunctional epoxide hydrolase 2 [Phytophthora nicotianae]|uniref:Bifunctional epoxide hydrolase 2 n=1 Tax=Phytophthora nicotianae TaxID=4792 RepID=A0A0W8DHY5_PHYNI|nr:Bifunctional epoxide hydrolase 2 [Phytophthora nicotianae]
MSKFTKFAIIGAGGVGSCIADDLLKANATITILTRDDGKAELQPLKERGATLAKVNYDDETSLQGALVGSEVVMLGYNIDEGAISVADEGDAKISIVTRSDFSHFVAHVLTTASKDSLEGAQLSIETGRVSPKEIAAQLEKKLGTTFRIKVLDYEETKKGYDTNVMAYLQTRIADGRCVPGTEEEVKSTIAKFFPEWDPSPWEEIIA